MATQHLPTTYTTPTQRLPIPTHLTEQVAELVASSKRPNTARAYQSDWRLFTSWCERHQLDPLPADPATVAAYLADRSTQLRVATLTRHLATISKAHKTAGYKWERNPAQSELVRATVEGIQATTDTTPQRAAAMTTERMLLVLSAIAVERPAGYGLPARPDPAGLRDRALLLVGWHAALRRSELAQLNWGDIAADPDGLKLTIRHSKTDKQHSGQLVGLPAEPDAPELCPVAALQAWRDYCELHGWYAAEGSTGTAHDQPVFRAVNRHHHLGGRLTGHAVGAIVSRRSEAVELDSMTGHSLRRGLIEAAHLAGVDDSTIMQTSRHKSVAVMRNYKGDAGVVSKSAGRGLLKQAQDRSTGLLKQARDC